MAANKPRKPNKNDMEIMGLSALVGGAPLIQAMIEDESRQNVRITPEKTAQEVSLPIRCDKTDERILAAWGVVLGSSHDRLFRKATIPAGWKSIRTDHYMYSFIVDEREQPRIYIMHKAAMCDRDASMDTVNRYKADFSADDWTDKASPYFPVIRDAHTKIFWRGKPVKGKDGDQMNQCRLVAQKVLDEVCPKYVPFHAIIAEARKVQDAQPEGMAYEEWNELCKKARETINEAVYQCGLLYWDEEVTFPPSLSEKVAGELYKASVEIYRGGQRVDSDSIGSSTRATDEAAIEHFSNKAKEFLDSYDEIRLNITKDGKSVFNHTFRRPRPTGCNKFLKNGMVYFMGDEIHDGY